MPAVGLKMKAEGLDPALLEYAFPYSPLSLSLIITRWSLCSHIFAPFPPFTLFAHSFNIFCRTPDAPAPPGEEEECDNMYCA